METFLGLPFLQQNRAGWFVSTDKAFNQAFFGMFRQARKEKPTIKTMTVVFNQERWLW